MGTYQSTEIEVTISADRIAPLAARLREEFVKDGGWDDYMKGWTDEQLVGMFLPLSEGNESSLQDEDAYLVKEDGTIVISGGFYGKISWDNDVVEAIYAEYGATGSIDSMCEEAPMRTRFKDGKVSQYGGVIIYPGDPEGEE